MNKPLSLIKEEVAMELTDVINNSGLPLFVVEHILEDLYNQVRIDARKQYEEDKIRYEQYLAQAELYAVEDEFEFKDQIIETEDV